MPLLREIYAPVIVNIDENRRHESDDVEMSHAGRSTRREIAMRQPRPAPFNGSSSIDFEIIFISRAC